MLGLIIPRFIAVIFYSMLCIGVGAAISSNYYSHRVGELNQKIGADNQIIADQKNELLRIAKQIDRQNSAVAEIAAAGKERAAKAAVAVQAASAAVAHRAASAASIQAVNPGPGQSDCVAASMLILKTLGAG